MSYPLGTKWQAGPGGDCSQAGTCPDDLPCGDPAPAGNTFWLDFTFDYFTSEEGGASGLIINGSSMPKTPATISSLRLPAQTSAIDYAIFAEPRETTLSEVWPCVLAFGATFTITGLTGALLVYNGNYGTLTGRPSGANPFGNNAPFLQYRKGLQRLYITASGVFLGTTPISFGGINNTDAGAFTWSGGSGTLTKTSDYTIPSLASLPTSLWKVLKLADGLDPSTITGDEITNPTQIMAARGFASYPPEATALEKTVDADLLIWDYITINQALPEPVQWAGRIGITVDPILPP